MKPKLEMELVALSYAPEKGFKSLLMIAQKGGNMERIGNTANQKTRKRENRTHAVQLITYS